MQIEFDEKEGKLFEEIIELYVISKDIMIYAEEVGGESFSPAKVSVQQQKNSGMLLTI
jgi:hypothetical protein